MDWISVVLIQKLNPIFLKGATQNFFFFLQVVNFYPSETIILEENFKFLISYYFQIKFILRNNFLK